MIARLLLLFGLITLGLHAEVKEEPKPAPAKLRFTIYNIPRKAKGTAVTFGVEAHGRTHFVKLGDRIPNSPYRAQAFERHSHPNADGTLSDFSELTLIHVETNEPFVLIFGKFTGVPSTK